MRRFLLWSVLLLLVAGLAAGGGGWWYLERFMETPSAEGTEQVVLLEPGSSVRDIARALHSEGIIDDPLLFRIGARLKGRDRSLKAGELLFPANATPMQVLDVLEAGKSVHYRISLPEGLTVAEVMKLIAEDEVLEGDMPEIPPEGSLLPETYFFDRGETREALVTRMREAMEAALADAWSRKAEDLPLATPEEALILASIIEKETSVSEEYPIVAGVFANRLRQEMLLQTDPTVIYAITRGAGPLGRALLRKDLGIDDPYNTYKYPGLPPGPIANPGREAIEAAVNPATTEFIFFVADGTGGHAFAATLDEHNRNVAKWRKIRDERK